MKMSDEQHSGRYEKDRMMKFSYLLSSRPQHCGLHIKRVQILVAKCTLYLQCLWSSFFFFICVHINTLLIKKHAIMILLIPLQHPLRNDNNVQMTSVLLYNTLEVTSRLRPLRSADCTHVDSRFMERSEFRRFHRPTSSDANLWRMLPQMLRVI